MERLIEKVNIEPVQDKEPEWKNVPATISETKDGNVFKKREVLL